MSRQRQYTQLTTFSIFTDTPFNQVHGIVIRNIGFEVSSTYEL